MLEVEITFCFVTPSLGNLGKEGALRCMPRDHDDNIMFWRTWYVSLLEVGSKLMNRHFNAINNTMFSGRVAGELSYYDRYYRREAFARHEAFLAGTAIRVRAGLPAELSSEDLKALFTAAGQYQGLSPYGWRDGWGRFTVEAVTPIEDLP